MAEGVDLGIRGTIQSETFGGKFDNNSTESEIATINCECNVLKRDFEAKRNGCEIHDGCVNSLSNTGEHTVNRSESTKSADVTMGIRLSNCPNSREIETLEAHFGKLFRIGSLGVYDWTDEIPSQPCRLVHAHSRSTQEASSTIECQGTVRHLSQIATFIGCKVNTNSDPKELVYYIANVAELGFNHIILFGETEYEIIFLDCLVVFLSGKTCVEWRIRLEILLKKRKNAQLKV
ncbi:9598_t:CDS:2 [Ambispora leptoticha]|uniref:9598_t:CDS:1 n=1 Tax=Ambispora leptoticha TaxID=144679 RepID=A0A9N9FUQ3_9GLOM|nr:9598_t:CDS:2 [Ambispora leptoticha]